MTPKQLREQCDHLFANRSNLLLLWQEMAENFYPERADFTLRRTIGDTFAENLMTSYPLICRRNLGDSISTMLRPTAKQWFHMTVQDDTRIDNEARAWLEWATTLQRRAMYDRVTRFTRAAKEGDHDYATFGQGVLSVRLNKNRDALLFRCWHLRDCAWQEDESGELGIFARKWRAKAIDLERTFGRARLHRHVIERLEQAKPFDEFDVYHAVVPAYLYDEKANGKPFFSVYYDIANDHVIEAVPTWNREYFVPRWQTVSGSQYAYSPATVAALPDGRLLQAMTYTLLEAGEKIVNPPIVATQDVVRSDVGLYAGGITWVDRDYDERLGDALRPLTQDARGMPLSAEMQRDCRAMLVEAFFLNKLTLPQRTPEMTAYEVGQRVQEYIRGALPLFEPMEIEYNGAMCDLTFEVLFRAGAFGSPFNIPKKLQGRDIRFRFESPLHDAIEAQKGAKFLEAKSYIAEAIALDQNAAAIPDAVTALRDVLAGVGVPAKWIRSETTAQQVIDAQEAAKQSATMLAAMQQGSEVAANLGAARKDMAAAEMPA